jgi:hypothetical protein
MVFIKGTMSHRPLTNASSLKITAAYCTCSVSQEGVYLGFTLQNPGLREIGCMQEGGLAFQIQDLSCNCQDVQCTLHSTDTV